MADEKRPQREQQDRQDRKKRRQEGEQQTGSEEVKRSNVAFSYCWAARVEEIIGRTGMRGEATQVRCKILEGKDQNKIIVRNVKGPVQIGDLLMLRETEIEARQLSKGGRGTQ